MASSGHVKIYLTLPVSIKETVSVMQLACPPEQLHSVTWRFKPVGKHYSPSVPLFSWKGREGRFYRFEMGAQRGDKRDILLDFGGVAVDRAETSLDRSGSSSLHVAPEIGPNGIT